MLHAEKFRQFGDYIDTLNPFSDLRETRGFNRYDKEFWPKLRVTEYSDKMARLLRKYSIQLVKKFGTDIAGYFTSYDPVCPNLKPTPMVDGSVAFVLSGPGLGPKFATYVALQKEFGLYWNPSQKVWFVPKYKIKRFDYDLYAVKIYNLGLSISAFPNPVVTFTSSGGGLPLEDAYNPETTYNQTQQVKPIPFKTFQVMRLSDGKFEIRWYPYQKDVNDLFSNNAGLISGITEYNPITFARETYSIELVLEALDKVKKIIPDWNFVFPDQDKVIKEYQDFHELLKLQIPEVTKWLDPKYALKPYQNEGVLFFEKTNGNALLGDEMGTGKSLQSLAWIVMRGFRVLVVCPKNVRKNWILESKKFFPAYYKLGEEITKIPKHMRLDNFQIVSTNYERLPKIHDKIIEGKFDVLIVDESHRVNNTKTATYKNVASVASLFKHKIFLSGTAVRNKKKDFFAQFEIIKPGLFKSKQELASMSYGSIWNRIQEVYLSRRKEQVLKDLPENISQIVEVPVDNAPDFELSDGLKFEEIARMKQEVSLAKAAATTNFVEDLLDGTESAIVVFSESVEVCKQIYESLGEDIAMLHHGQLSDTQRESIKEEFQKGHTTHRVLITTRQSLAEGANLTRADRVVFNDLPWTAAAIAQAQARCHRLGSVNDVNSYWITIADNNFDMKIATILKKKYELCKKINEGKQVTKEEKQWLDNPVSIDDLQKT